MNKTITITLWNRKISINNSLYQKLKMKDKIYDIKELETDTALCLKHTRNEHFKNIISRYSDREIAEATENAIKTHLEVL